MKKFGAWRAQFLPNRMFTQKIAKKLEQAIADIDSGSYEDFVQNFPEYLRLDPATAVSHS